MKIKTLLTKTAKTHLLSNTVRTNGMMHCSLCKIGIGVSLQRIDGVMVRVEHVNKMPHYVITRHGKELVLCDSCLVEHLGKHNGSKPIEK